MATKIQVRRDTAAAWEGVKDDPSSALAPGEFGLDTTNNILKLGPGTWGDAQVIAKGNLSAGNLQAVTDAGNNTTNDITLGTDKITLDATSGSAVVSGELQVAPDGNSGFYLGDKSAVDSRPESDGKNGARIFPSSITASRSDDGVVFQGRTVSKVGAGTNDYTSTIYGDGSAHFKGVLEQGSWNAGLGNLLTSGYLFTRHDGAGKDNACFAAFAGGATDDKIVLKMSYDGSAVFTGDVLIDDSSSGVGLSLTNNAVVNNNPVNGSGIIVGEAAVRPAIATGVPDTNGNISLGTTANPFGSAAFAGDVYCNVPDVRQSGMTTEYGLVSYVTGGSSTDYLARFTSGGDGGERAAIFADGSATFAGNIDITGQGGLAGYGWSIANNGGLANKTPGGTKISFTNDGSATLAGVVTTDDRFVCNAGGNKTNDSVAFLMYQEDATTDAVSITAGGSATFAGAITAQEFNTGGVNESSTTTGGASVREGRYLVQRPAAQANANTTKVFSSYLGTTEKIAFNADGNAAFASYVAANNDGARKDASSTFLSYGNSGFSGGATAYISANGSATFNGDIDANNVSFKLEPDNDANYTVTTEEYEEQEELTPYVPAVEATYDEYGNELTAEVPEVPATYQTVTKTHNIRVYTGPTLDVKDHLTKTQAALTALKTAAQDNATDLAGLKAAIVVALANI